jgi:hypothetical protein
MAAQRSHPNSHAEAKAWPAVAITPDLRRSISRGAGEHAVRFAESDAHLIRRETNIDLADHDFVLNGRWPRVEDITVFRDSRIDGRTAGEPESQR